MRKEKDAKRAVEAPRRNYFMMNPYDVVVIGLDTEDGPEHYLWDERIHLPIDPAMVANIRTYGVQKAIKATKDGERVLVVEGRQRVKHNRLAWDQAIKAGEEPPRLPVDLIRGTEQHVFGVASVGNGFTQAETPMQRAGRAHKLFEMSGDEAHVAVTFGVKVPQLREWFSLLGVAPQVRRAVDTGEVSPSAAAKLAKLAKAEQVAQLEQLREQGIKPTTRAVANKVRTSKGKAASKTPIERINATTAALRKLHADNAGQGAVRPPSAVNDAVLEALDKIAKALHGTSMDKLLARGA